MPSVALNSNVGIVIHVLITQHCVIDSVSLHKRFEHKCRRLGSSLVQLMEQRPVAECGQEDHIVSSSLWRCDRKIRVSHENRPERT